MFTIWCWAMRPLPSVNGMVKTSGRVPAARAAVKVGAVQLYSSGSTVTQGYFGLELADLEVERVNRFLCGAGPQHADADRHRLLGAGARVLRARHAAAGEQRSSGNARYREHA